jgi:hypothetical protein
MRAIRKTSVAVRSAFFLIFMATVLPRNAAAYVDPGTTGMLSQVLYVLFYGALGVFFYCLRYLKGYIANLKEFLARYFGRKA